MPPDFRAVKITEVYRYRAGDGAADVISTYIYADLDSAQSGEYQRFWINPNPNQWGLTDKITYPRCSNTSCSATTASAGQVLDTDWSNGRIKKVNGWTNDLTYHPSGTWATIPHTNGTQDSHTVQASNNARTLALNTTNPGVLWNTGSYTYDGSGNIVTIGDTSGYDDLYRYDKVNRLTRAYVRDQATGDSTRQDYTYDVFGNMTEVKTWPVGGGSQTTTIAVNANTNRLSVAGYDASGNMTSWGSDAYTYDTANSMTEQNGRWFFLYNFSGERVATIDWQGSIATRQVDFTIRGPGNQVLSTFNLVGEDQSGNWTHEMDYIWMGRRLLGTEDGSGVQQHYHTDHLGSIRLVTDSLGAKVSEHEYLPYGEELTAAGNGVMKFTGHERDSDTGMDYMHARFYTNHLGRFMGVDPVLQGAGIWNRYSYVGGNPVSSVDPDGRQAMMIHWTTLGTYLFGDFITVIGDTSRTSFDNSTPDVSIGLQLAHATPASGQVTKGAVTQLGDGDPIGGQNLKEKKKSKEQKTPPDCLVEATQPHFPNVDLKKIRFKSPVPRLPRAFGNPRGWTPGGSTQWYRQGLIPDGTTSTSVNDFVHETIHTRQGAETGRHKFRFLYMTSKKFRDRMEDEAYAQAPEITDAIIQANEGKPPCP